MKRLNCQPDARRSATCEPAGRHHRMDNPASHGLQLQTVVI